MQSRGIILLWVAMLLLSCSPKSLREAKDVVSQADSLRAAGQMYMDSTCLAQSYNTLHAWRYVCADEYTHACYHYGRLLREKDNPVEAMQCFINATHTRTRDYHILGRVYSNMGDIAHLAGEFPLAYDMYERSGQMYLKNRDSLLYYYDLNNMAFELAEQGKKEETLDILTTIEQQCTDLAVITKTWETQARLYLHTMQYDSALCAVNHMGNDPASNIIKTQVFWHIENSDSSLYYARCVLNSCVASEQDKYNALYVILNYDTTLQNEELIALSSQRSDIETDILIPLHNQWTVAIQLLRQDLHRKPNLGWLYAVVATLLLIGSVISLYVYKKRQKRQLLSQHIAALEDKTETTIAQMRQQVEERCLVLMHSSSLRKDLQWNDYEALCHFTNQQFYFLADKLQQKGLSEKEIRLCILSLMDCSYDTMADMLIYAPNGVGKFKLRVAKKLGTTAKKMQEFLIDMAIMG